MAHLKGLVQEEPDFKINLKQVALEQQWIFILAKCYFLHGDYKLCKEILDYVNVDGSTEIIEPNSSYYGRISITLTLCLKILCNELLESTSECFKYAKILLNLLQNETYFHPVFKYRHLWLEYVEEALYISVFLFLDQSNWNLARETCLLFLQFTGDASTQNLLRISILKQYVYLLANYFNRSGYIPSRLHVPTEFCSSDERFPWLWLDRPMSLSEELEKLLPAYEKCVTENFPFPPAGQRNRIVDVFYDDMILIYTTFFPRLASVFVADLNFATNLSGSDDSKDLELIQRSRIYNSALPTHKLQDSIYNSMAHTFRSRKALRRLALSSLMIESMEETLMAVKAYLEKDKRDDLGEWFRRPGIKGSVCSSDFERPGSKHISDITEECIDDILVVLISGSNAALRSFHIQHALIYAEKAVLLCKDSPDLVEPSLLSLAYHHLGICYSKIAFETLEHEHFFNLQEYSYVWLKESLRFNPFDWLAGYHLAYQCMEMDRVGEAIKYIDGSLKLNPNFVPGWHLKIFITLVNNNLEGTELGTLVEALKIFKDAVEIMLSGRTSSSNLSGYWISKEECEEWLNILMSVIWVKHLLLDNQHLSNDSLSKKNRDLETFDLLKKEGFLGIGKVCSPKFDYSKLFELYSFGYYSSNQSMSTKLEKFIPEKSSRQAHLFDLKTILYPGNCDAENEMAQPIESTETVKLVIDHLQKYPHPQISTFYPTLIPLSNSRGFSVSSAFFPNDGEISDPQKHSLFLRSRKLRYMELWLNLAQAYRRSGKLHDARMACLEAQKIERGNADIEFELGMISLLTPAQTSHTRNSSAQSNARPNSVIKSPFHKEEVDLKMSAAISIITKTDKRGQFPEMLLSSNLLSSASGASSLLDPRFDSKTIFSYSNVSSAITHFLAALTYDDEHMYARTWLGRCFWMQNKYEIARAELERAVRGGRVRGNNVWFAWNTLGLVYQSLGDPSKACECFGLAMKYEKSSFNGASLRGLEVLPKYF